MITYTCVLTDEFYNDYNTKEYPELMNKGNRPYFCLLIKTNCGYSICVPYRSNINHPYCFRFSNTTRSKEHKSGLDYSKMIIVSNYKYIDNRCAIIDSDEFAETMSNLKHITSQSIKYLQDYINFKTNKNNMSQKEYHRKYSRSTLSYFDDILL